MTISAYAINISDIDCIAYTWTFSDPINFRGMKGGESYDGCAAG